jgi:glycerol-3-phosphate dehydrogenase (NAD(P)+)
VETAPAVVELARRLKVELPICETVLELVEGRLDARAAVGSLLSRPFKGEN